MTAAGRWLTTLWRTTLRTAGGDAQGVHQIAFAHAQSLGGGGEVGRALLRIAQGGLQGILCDTQCLGCASEVDLWRLATLVGTAGRATGIACRGVDHTFVTVDGVWGSILGQVIVVDAVRKLRCGPKVT
ncbi:MAG: hypothetical protein D6790_04110, partial [Caldilineae bacterium]